MKHTRSLLTAGAAGIASSLLLSGLALAQTSPAPSQATPQGWGRGHMMRKAPGVFGTVSAISGSTLTVESKGWGPNAAATTYTVDASNATIGKNGATASIGDITIGDTVMVMGTVSGASVAATTIKDGVVQGMPRKGGPGGALTQLQGNGQPVVGGSVTAISGSVLTVAAKAGPSYSVDASGATVVKGGATSSISSVVVGDGVIVQGTVNGSSVTASSVIDQGVPAAPHAGSQDASPMPMRRGFFGAIGGLLQRIFGFF